MAEAETVTILKSFIVGLKLDISMLGYTLFFLLLIEIITLSISGKYNFRVLRLFLAVVLAIFTLLLLGNTIIYSFWSRMLDSEALSYLKTPAIIAESLSIIQIILFTAIPTLLIIITNYVFRKSTKQFKPSEKLSLPKRLTAIAVALVLAILTILPIRGGLGTAPINAGAAYFSENLFLNHAALNPIWNLMYSFKRQDELNYRYQFMEYDKANLLFNELTSTSRQTTKLLKNPKPNVVIILLESFSAQIIGKLGGIAATPNFDSLCSKGVLFSNIYASSDRSDKSLVATMAGYPVVPTYSIMQYPTKSQSLNFLPKDLVNNGYCCTSYTYGGDIGFKGMNAFVTLAGFEKTVSISNFPIAMRGEKWGVHDEHTFESFKNEVINETGSPFLKFFFTLSSHEPFDVPMEKIYADPYTNSVHYTDKCLGDFFAEIQQSPVWENTLFVLIADHGIAGPRKLIAPSKEKYHIPMLWLGGALAKTDTVISTLGSQTDLAATLLNQLNISSKQFKFSKNLLAEKVNQYAFFTYPDAFGFITPAGYFVYDNVSEKIINSHGKVSETIIEQGKAYLQILSDDHFKK